MTAPHNSGFIVRGANGRPIGAVITGKGVAANLFAARAKAGKLGEFTSAADAIAAVRKAHSSDREK
jgi:hypothetical protein